MSRRLPPLRHYLIKREQNSTQFAKSNDADNSNTLNDSRKCGEDGEEHPVEVAVPNVPDEERHRHTGRRVRAHR